MADRGQSQENEKKVVMAAIDDSDCSRYALEWALQNLQDSISNSELLIFNAQSIADYSYIYASSFGAISPEFLKNMQECQKELATSLLEKAKDLCSKYGIAVKTITQVGDPKEVICQTVEKLRIQLLILGSHGRGPLKRAFLGSVSNYCVHNAKCPVLVVKKTD